MLRSKLFKKYYPLDRNALCLLEDGDRERLLRLVAKTEFHVNKINECSQYRAEHNGLAHFVMIKFNENIDLVKIEDNIRNSPSLLTQDDISFLNDILYYNKYSFSWLLQIFFPTFCLRRPSKRGIR